MVTARKTENKPKGTYLPHLGEYLRSVGGNNEESDFFNQLVTDGLIARDLAKKAARLEEKGTTEKLNTYVSDAGKCPRKITYSFTQEDEVFTSDSLMNFVEGAVFEEMIAECLGYSEDLVIRREVRVEIPNAPKPTTGRIDYLIESPSNGFIAELKSINKSAAYFMMKDEQEKGLRGKDDHRKQLNLYLHASRLGLIPGVEHPYEYGYLVYGIKGTVKGEPKLRVYRVDYDAHEAANDLQVMATAHEMAIAGAVPPRPSAYSRTAFPCSYCGFRDLCWSGGN